MDSFSVARGAKPGCLNNKMATPRTIRCHAAQPRKDQKPTPPPERQNISQREKRIAEEASAPGGGNFLHQI